MLMSSFRSRRQFHRFFVTTLGTMVKSLSLSTETRVDLVFLKIVGGVLLCFSTQAELASYAQTRPPTKDRTDSKEMEDTFTLASTLHRLLSCNSEPRVNSR